MMHTFTNTEFTRSMKKTHTIYMPEMLHYHNELLCAAFAFGGYKLAVVPEQEHICYETQSLVNKDYCTCAIGIIGNLLTFVRMMTVTGIILHFWSRRQAVPAGQEIIIT